MTTLQVRIGEDDKQHAKKILAALGLDMSTAIKIFLKTVIRKKGLPFPLTTENNFLYEEEQHMLKEEEEALVSGKRYDCFTSALADIK